MGFKVLIIQDIASVGKDYLLKNGHEIKMGTGIKEGEIAGDVVDCDAIIVRTAKITRRVLEAGKKLKIVARHGVGYDNIDIQAAAELGIQVVNAPESNSASVAEFTISMILAATKKLVPLHKSMIQGDFFFKNKNMGMEMPGKTLGVLGFGRIGSLVAKKAALGLEMKVLAYDPFCPKEKFPDYVERLENLDEILERSDVVTIHVPSMPDTNGMIGLAQLKKMKKTAWLINCARGELLRENEVAQALKDGVIAGAAVDVYLSEPPAVDHPFLTLPNVLATPHMASNTDESMDRMALHPAMEIHRVFQDEAVKWPVNKPVKK
jgi:D-3-phosphoglycerate dehydrogenase